MRLPLPRPYAYIRPSLSKFRAGYTAVRGWLMLMRRVMKLLRGDLTDSAEVCRSSEDRDIRGGNRIIAGCRSLVFLVFLDISHSAVDPSDGGCTNGLLTCYAYNVLCCHMRESNQTLPLNQQQDQSILCICSRKLYPEPIYNVSNLLCVRWVP